MMIVRRSPLSRRALIRGLGGVAITLPAGLQVRSTPVGADGTVCVYRTTQPVHLLPHHLLNLVTR